METKRYFRYFTIADYEREQKWLNAMSRSGWNFVRTNGFVYTFEVYCPYPDAEDDISIKLGEEYLCYVYRISEKDHQFRCRVLNKVIK